MSERPTWSRSLIPDSDDDFIDDKYQSGELERMEYDELRSIAAEHPSEDVHGRMSKGDLRDALEGLKRVSDNV